MTGSTVEVDQLVNAIAPRLCRSAVRRRDAVLVTGPWLAGVTGVLAALRDRLSDRAFVETTDLAADEAPMAVVFVVSAAAAVTESDCALLDAAAVHTDAVIGVVSKVDVHRQWPQILQAARTTMSGYAPRYRRMPWIAVAARPDVGEPRVDGLVAAVEKQLSDATLQRRNALRQWEARLLSAVRCYQQDAEATGRRARMAALREQRDTALRQRRLLKAERAIALRSRVAKARVQLSYFARNRCSSVRAELHEDVADLTRARLPDFETYARSRISEVIAEVDRGASAHLLDVAHELGLPIGNLRPADAPPQVEVVAPARQSRRLETQLMTLLGAGFGLGVGLTSSRLFADLAAGFTAAGTAACLMVGLAVAIWVLRTRSLLHDRAVLDRWITDLVAAARSTAEELVALRVLAAEETLTAALADRNEAAAEQLADRIGGLDAELAEHAAAAARAAAAREQELPALRRALDAVRAELP